MELDLTARRNLELTETLRGKEKRGSLLWVLDKTKTAMGARNLRAWLQQPLVDVAAIDRRLSAVAALAEHTVAREELTLALSGIADMERLIGKVVYGSAGGRDLVSLRASMERIPAVKAQLAAFLRRAAPAGSAAGGSQRSGRPDRPDAGGRAAVLRP